MKISKKNFIVGLFLLLLGCFLMYFSLSVENIFQASAGEMGVMTYPRIILGIWIFFSICLMLSSFEQYDFEELVKILPTIAKSCAAIAMYILLLQYVGIILSTFIFLVVFFWLMQYATITKRIISAAIGSVLTWLIFEKILGIIFPNPFWISFI